VSSPKTSRIKKRRTNAFAYAMLAPDLIGLAVFLFFPIIMAFYVSLHEWDALSPMQFIGIENYLTILGDSDWWRSLGLSLSYSLLFVGLVFCGSLLLAVFLDSLKKSGEILRTVYFIPFSISTVVASMIWIFMYNDKTGYLNGFLRLVGLPGQGFLSSSSQALGSIAVSAAWTCIGYYAVLFLAAIKDIPPSYYEAAVLDGANKWTLFWNITFPLIKNVSVFVFIITTIGSFQVFDQVKVMTNGGPANSTNVSVFYIYRQCFEYMKLGYSSALAFVLFVIIFFVSVFQLKFTKADSVD
jgi:multiple sugar transport system permease protein